MIKDLRINGFSRSLAGPRPRAVEGFTTLEKHFCESAKVFFCFIVRRNLGGCSASFVGGASPKFVVVKKFDQIIKKLYFLFSLLWHISECYNKSIKFL
jgi:hypothetical protein